jgi:electron-transferring-flavoprotein dehydrogenase
VRNYRQAFARGLVRGALDFALQRLTGGRGLVARRAGHADHESMRPLAQSRLTKPAYDGGASLDKLTDVYHSGAIHEEDQPAHLLVPDPTICVERCTAEYGNPCQHFCPAAVDQRLELRALQDLRHRRSLREHRVGRARGRWRAEVRGPVTPRPRP